MYTLPHSAARTLRQFCAETGLTQEQLVIMATHALATHLATTGSLTLPLRLYPMCPACQDCPHCQSQSDPLPANIIRGNWAG